MPLSFCAEKRLQRTRFARVQVFGSSDIKRKWLSLVMAQGDPHGGSAYETRRLIPR